MLVLSSDRPKISFVSNTQNGDSILWASSWQWLHWVLRQWLPPPMSDVRRKLLDPPHHSKNSGRPGLLYSFTSHNRFFINKNNACLLKNYQVNLIKFKSLDWSNLGIETCFYAIPTHLQKENSQSILIYSLAGSLRLTRQRAENSWTPLPGGSGVTEWKGFSKM